MKRKQGAAKAKTNACYTSPLAQMSASFPRKLTSLLVSALVFSLIAVAQEPQNPFTPQATQLVSQIMNKAGSPGFVTLAVENRSSLSATDVSLARKAMEAAVRGANARIVKPERAVAEINVTISENVQGLLWIAEVKQGLTTQTIMLQSGSPAAAPVEHVSTLTVRRTSIFKNEDGTRIIDFALTDASHLLTVEPERLAAYALAGGRWQQVNAFAIRHSQPWPRDLRGHITVQQSQLNVFLPGVQCSGTLSADHTPTNLNCNETDDPWLLDGALNAFFPAGRNFFSGIVRGLDQSLSPFYSTAVVGDSNPVSIFAGTDGRARVYSSMAQPPRVYSGWGSDVAAIHSTCGSQWQVLASRPGDSSQDDGVQAMEMADRDPVSASPVLPTPGSSITSMWTSADGKTVRLITQDHASSHYEASILSIDCSR